MAEFEFALSEFGLGKADFVHACPELLFAFDHGAALFVGGDLVQLAQVKGGGDSRDELQGATQEEFFIQVFVGNGGAVFEGDEVCGGQDVFGVAEGARFESAGVVAIEFAATNGNAVGFQEQGLDLGEGEAVEPAIQLRDLVAGEVGEFGGECAFSHNGLWVRIKGFGLITKKRLTQRERHRGFCGEEKNFLLMCKTVQTREIKGL